MAGNFAITVEGLDPEDLAREGIKAGKDLVESASRGDVRGAIASGASLASKAPALYNELRSDLADPSHPPALLAGAVKEFAAQPGIKEDLYRYGTQLADKVWDEAMGAVMAKLRALVAPSKPSKASAKPQRTWMGDVVKPVINPFLNGLTDRLKQRSVPVARAVAYVMYGTHAVAFVLGRVTKRS